MNSKKRTIGIVTIEDYRNYGNRLQNYALTKLLESENFTVINGIRVMTKRDYISDTKGILKKAVKKLIPFIFLKNRIAPIKTQPTELLKKKEEKFRSFVNGYTKPVQPIITSNYRQAMKALKQYNIDYFVAGSDQIWNPLFEGNNYDFLTFAPKNMRLSFAASIGEENIPSDMVERYTKNLQGMKYLSVREQRAVEIIKELTGRDADLTLDPTLLLESEKWLEAVKKPEFHLEKPYICTYFLGETPEAVNLFAKGKGMPVYPMNAKEFPDLYTLDPAEFLYLIQNADYVLTDSFHAVAFSIKFHKEFYVFKRKQKGMEGMFSRIETITKRFDLENRIQNRDCIDEQPIVAHWNVIDEALLSEKKKTMNKLIDNMG